MSHISPNGSPRLAVFDMDGTLVDSQHMITAAMARAFAAEGLAPPPLNSVRRVVGLSLETAIAGLAPDIDDAVRSALEEHYKDAFFQLRAAGEEAEAPFDGAVASLNAFRTAGWTLGIATGKSARGLKATLEHFGLEDRFVTLQTADIAMGKPAPDMLHRAMADTGVGPEATVMIGDTSFDMEMARNAGVAGIGVGWGYHDEGDLMSAGAHEVVADFADLHIVAEALIPPVPDEAGS